jgi:hypothetical protein
MEASKMKFQSTTNSMSYFVSLCAGEQCRCSLLLLCFFSRLTLLLTKAFILSKRSVSTMVQSVVVRLLANGTHYVSPSQDRFEPLGLGAFTCQLTCLSR